MSRVASARRSGQGGGVDFGDGPSTVVLLENELEFVAHRIRFVVQIRFEQAADDGGRSVAIHFNLKAREAERRLTEGGSAGHDVIHEFGPAAERGSVCVGIVRRQHDVPGEAIAETAALHLAQQNRLLRIDGGSAGQCGEPLADGAFIIAGEHGERDHEQGEESDPCEGES